MMFLRSICCCTFILSGCASHVAVLQQDKHDTSIALTEIRSELADLKHALNNTQVELRILDEEVKEQEGAWKKNKGMSTPQEGKLALLEKKLLLVEQAQEKIHTDLKQLSSHANQTNSCLHQYSAKIGELEQALERQYKLINEVVDLKSSLKALVTTAPLPMEKSSTYTVKAGDSLEKIAKNHKISVEALKKANQLSPTQNKILVGQELKIPPS